MLDLKHQIFDRQGIAVRDQRLIAAGKQLEDCRVPSEKYIKTLPLIHLDRRLEQYGVRNVSGNSAYLVTFSGYVVCLSPKNIPNHFV